MKRFVYFLIFIAILSLLSPVSADISLLKKFSHKTSFSLEQLVFKAENILIVTKLPQFISEKKTPIDNDSKKTPFISTTFNFKVIDTIKTSGKLSRSTEIRVKEPYNDLAYTVHYSYYTRGFVIEPFIGEYLSSANFDKQDTLIIFVNNFTSNRNFVDSTLYQFIVLNSYEKFSKKAEIKQILNRPPPDMKKLFLKHRKTN